MQDIFVVEVSDNGGADWQTLEQVGPTGAEIGGGWFYVEYNLFTLSGFVPNSQFAIRFTTSDTDPQSLVEAAIDGVTLLNIDCCPSTNADLNGDGRVSVNDLLDLLATWGACPGLPDPCPADLNSDGLVNIIDLLQLLTEWGPCS